MVSVSETDKFKILLWKNFMVLWRQKTDTTMSVITPLLALVFLFVNRPIVKYKPEIIYETQISVDTFNKGIIKDTGPEAFYIAYSPNTSPPLNKIVQKAANSMGMKYIGFLTSKDLERSLQSERAEGSSRFAGIVFPDSWAGITKYPQKLTYTIRFPAMLRNSSRDETWQTNLLVSQRLVNGPRNIDNENGGTPIGYMNEGFIALQSAVSSAFIELSSGQSNWPEIYLQRYPFAAYIDDAFLLNTISLTPFFFVMTFSSLVLILVKAIALEKENQLKEIMKVMGVHNHTHWMAWFTLAFIFLSIDVFLIVLLLKMKPAQHSALLPCTSFLLMVFFLVACACSLIGYCFFISVLFNKATTAVFAFNIGFLILFTPYSLILLKQTPSSFGTMLFASLFPISAMSFGVTFIYELELKGQGLQWHNMFIPASIEHDMSVGVLTVMLLISTIIFIALALYIEQILPGEYGVPQVWYFPFKKSFWYGTDAVNTRETGSRSDNQNVKPNENFEPEPLDGVVGVQIKHLSKKFGEKIAVNNITMNLFEGEILVLLGANGAGKTTTISMLTGMCKPTSGTVVINGHDITTDLDGARRSLSICPQHDILFDYLTVRDHLYFYGSLKGLKGDDLEKQIDKHIRKFQLIAREHDLSTTLSGGMKRKLSFIVAVIGGAKVVLCDEPSSGLDPAARRHLWNILKQEKLNRTILLTTHSMDEADFLADRIAVMAEGNLKCYGTTFFLKRKFGGGYKLVCNKGPGCDVSGVTAFMGRFVSGIRPYSEIGAELVYEIPRRYSPALGKMFKALEGRSESLKLDGYGLSGETMEEVYLKLNEQTNQPATKDKSRRSRQRESTNPIFTGRLLKGGYLQWHQIYAMFLKNLYTIRRNKTLYILQNLIVVFFMVLYLSQSTPGSGTGLPPLEISLLKYPKSVTILEFDAATPPNSVVGKTIRSYENIVKSHGSDHKLMKINEPFIPFMLQLQAQNQALIDKRYITAATIKSDKIIVWLNNELLHSAPLTLNLLHNALAKATIGENAAIEVVNHPLPFTKSERSKYNSQLTSIGFIVVFAVPIAMCFITAMYVIMPIKERACRAKLLQFVSGVDVITFWGTQYLCDMLTFLVPVLVMLILFVILQVDVFSTFEGLKTCFLLLIIFGLSVLPLTYYASFFSEVAVNGFSCLYTINIVFQITAFIVLAVEEVAKADTGVFKYFLIFPHGSLVSALYNIFACGQTKQACNQLKDLIHEIPCNMYPDCCRDLGYFDWQRPGIGREIIYFFLGMIIWIMLLLITEYKCVGKFEQIFGRVFRMMSTPLENEHLDNDVLAERERIENMSLTQINTHALVMDKLTKYYCTYLAVNKISLTVSRGECFGLLGVNGAGKTTTFKMLTRDESISAGRAFVNGLNLTRNVKDVYQDLGYCPQFDGIFENLTGRETLIIYSLLNGIPLTDINKVILYLAKSLDFKNYLDILTKNYSGGNKRKLNASIAVIGNKAVILLDEPTCGMDPGSRRRLWNFLCYLRDSGKAIVLTSHSMEESEALCTRLAIMVNGEFKCLGSIQHVKNKFSRGFVLKTKLGDGLIQTSIIVQEFVLSTFEGATVKDQQYGLVTFYIPREENTWSDIFNTIEGNKKQLNIEDYILTQTTLEEIFLEFAESQTEDRRTN